MPRDTEIPDEQLVDRCLRAPGGDVRAFEHLVKRHQDRVLANCRYLSGSSVEAEDLAQEVFVKAFFGLRNFERRSKFSTWLQRIKINHCLNFNKKRRRVTFVSVEAPEMASQPDLQTPPQAERAVDAKDQRQRISAILDEMSENLRVPLILRDSDGLSYAEIAEQLEISLSAVKMRIKRGREEFGHRYRSDLEGEGGGVGQ